MAVDTVREEQAIRRLIDSLLETYADSHSPDDIQTTVTAVRARFDGHPVREFVPILVERIVHRELAPPAPGSVIEEAAAAVEQPAAASSRADRRRAARGAGLVIDRRTLVGAGAAVMVGIVVVALVTRDREPTPSATPAIPGPTVVRGVVGSEKLAYFEDARVVEALARHGLRVEAQPAGSRQIAQSVDLSAFDFAFPSSSPAAERIQRARNINTKYTPFSSPMAIATFQPIADLLTEARVLRPGPVPTFDMARYLELVNTNTEWAHLANNTTYPVRKNILVSTTDPRTSNSAAMYAAIASFVANDRAVVQDERATQAVLPTLQRLFAGQGYTENSTQGPFQEYLAAGMGPSPLVLIYEAQFVEAAVQGRTAPGMVLTYPSPTVLSRHTLVPLRADGDRLGRLLSTDPDLQRLAAEHGFRTGDADRFAKVTAEHRVPVQPDLIDVVDTPTYDTLEALLDAVAKSYN
ncbi:three-helix bundle dimerization domain-containing protein [Nocardia sp. NPDC127579]|uniref:three-helix bundle dimerization domain-containing protein n=1 Tax=Nocardia sp. NPDC127579 TaxID=3345402 RepID=UPI003629AD21